MERQELKIPIERVAVLIGTKGAVKKHLEKRLQIHIEVDSKEGDVLVEGEDSVTVYETTQVIKAIGRGFHPDVAQRLLDKEYMMELLNVQEYIGNSKKHMRRVKGRVIGREGRAREMIEDMTDTSISVYGKTVGIIGRIEWVSVARQAMEMLLQGAPHGNVYKWLERKKRDMMRREFEEKDL
ncbi:MAG TPA: KH domain-containing protein [Candidatus Nanoarchaeia archaeon]|nr:KH domain-containing protein [Candidatus Nanoarchaeia archaeon]